MRQNNEKLNEKINVMKKSFAKEIDINKNSNGKFVLILAL